MKANVPERMLAIRIREFGGPNVLRLEQVPVPRPGDAEVLIRVQAVGVNFADVLTRRGEYPWPTPLPLVLGYEAVGIVVAVGRRVRRWREGDRVAGLVPRSYAEYAVAAEDLLMPWPSSSDFTEGAALPLQGLTAYHALHTFGRLRPGERVLVHAAAGGVGLLAVQLVKQAGASVLGTASTEEKLILAKEFGADVTINYRERDFTQAVLQWTQGEGVDLILDGVGQSTLEGDLRCLAPLGRLVLYGRASGNPNPIEYFQLLHRSLTVSAFSLNTLARRPPLLMAPAAELVDQVTKGHLRLKIDHVLPLSRAAEAHRLLEDRRSVGKIVLVPDRLGGGA